MRNCADIEQHVDITAPACWAANYSFEGTWSNRNSMDPWTWWAPGANRDVYPHFTMYAADVENRKLKRFHLTKNFNNDTSKPLHVYYNVNTTSGRVRYTNTDANRLGSQADAGLAWVDQNALALDQLAQAFVNIALS
jgi:hypothetical protein